MGGGGRAGAESTEKRVIRWARWAGGGLGGGARSRGALWEGSSNMWGGGGRKVKFGLRVLRRKLEASL